MAQNNESFILTAERLSYQLLRESDFDGYLLLDSKEKECLFYKMHLR
ncbi:hypothetical protein [Legionella bozemanae]|nr:hypothetical protein [Legionella bozemanae]